MNTQLRNRVVLPILLPLGVLLGLGLLVGGLALVLLYNPRATSLMIALVLAAAVMVAFSLANSVDEDEMTGGRRLVIGATLLLPLLGGVGASLYAVNGGVPEEEWMINRLPALTVPEGAEIAAQNSENFCLQTEDGGCEDTQEVTFPAQPDSGVFAFRFVNLQAAVPHNVQLFELADDGGEPAPGEIVFGVAEGSATINGVDEIVYQVSPNEFEEGQQLYFNCVVHPAMQGVLTIGAPADGAGGE